MKAIFTMEWKQSQKSLFIYMVLMLLLIFMAVVEFAALKDVFPILDKTLASYPKIIKIMFGINDYAINSPVGTYACMYFWYSLIAYPYAACFGAHMISKEERFKTAEFLYTKPYKRRDVLMAKSLVGIVNMAVMILIVTALNILFVLPVVDGEALIPQVMLSMLGMFFTQLIFMAIGLLCAVLLKNSKAGVLASIGVLLLSYALAFVIEYVGDITILDIFTPVRYFNVAMVIENGMNPLHLLLTAVIISSCLFAGTNAYQNKDL